jgi:hypothetical protein
MAFIVLWRRDAFECIASIDRSTFVVHLLNQETLIRSEDANSAAAAVAISASWAREESLVSQTEEA